MAYDKPKVTIDIEEYNSLIDEKNKLSSDEYVTMAKTAMAAFMNHRGNINDIVYDLKKAGIAFYVHYPDDSSGNDRLTAKNISISKITTA
jgi:hypothetical protein